ncbi:putative sporulation protein YtxC [Paenibacillus macerans]|uniref:putative sporulation protein YtxC n=1 Tax=Paenibacillus macerans TaxID=44252 RepID=UPI003D322A36
MDFFTIRVNIGSAESEELFKAYLRETVGRLHTCNVELSYGATLDGGLEAVVGRRAETAGDQETREQLLDLLARGLTEYIMDVKEEEFVTRIMNREYSFASQEEMQNVNQLVNRMLAEDEEEGGRAEEQRKALVQEAIRSYLRQSPILHLDGFAVFRLKEYEAKLREIIDFAIDEYLLDKQYEEFIGLLQYFVYFQEPLTPLVHLMHKQGHEFAILNEKFTTIHAPAPGGVVARIADQEMEMEDVIVSTLISLSPDRILIHTQDPDAQVITTISRIFGERVELCLLCPHCKLFHQEYRRLDQGT